MSTNWDDHLRNIFVTQDKSCLCVDSSINDNDNKQLFILIKELYSYGFETYSHKDLTVDILINALLKHIKTKTPEVNIPEMIFYSFHFIKYENGTKSFVLTTDFGTLFIRDKRKVFISIFPNPDYNNSDKVLQLEDDNFRCLVYGCYNIKTHAQLFINAINMSYTLIYPNSENNMKASKYEFFISTILKESNIEVRSLCSILENPHVFFCDKMGHANMMKQNVEQEMTLDGFSVGFMGYLKYGEDILHISVRGELSITDDPIKMIKPEFIFKMTPELVSNESIDVLVVRNKIGADSQYNRCTFYNPYPLCSLPINNKNNFTSLNNRSTYINKLEYELGDPFRFDGDGYENNPVMIMCNKSGSYILSSNSTFELVGHEIQIYLHGFENQFYQLLGTTLISRIDKKHTTNKMTPIIYGAKLNDAENTITIYGKAYDEIRSNINDCVMYNITITGNKVKISFTNIKANSVYIDLLYNNEAKESEEVFDVDKNKKYTVEFEL